MELILLPQHYIAIVSIFIMIGSLIIARIKKIMMTYALIIANIVIFFITLLFQKEIIGGIVNGIAYYGLGFRPFYLSIDYLPNIYTLFTSMFVHGGFAHIVGNMLVFFFMGIAFEQRIGWKKFIVIYLLTGVCGALTHSIFNLDSKTTLIGASGAIFGILGAFAYSYPRDEVVMPIPLGIIMVFRKVKVIYAAILFSALETAIVLLDVQDTTAHFAHFGGLVSGVILAAALIGNKAEKIKKDQSTIYYDISHASKSQKINFSNLRKLATTPDQNMLLDRIENENVLQVRDAWLEHFLDQINCPKCGKKLKSFNGKIWCEDNHFKTSY